MHPNYWQITILLVVDLCLSLAYFMMTQPLPIAGKLPMKTLVAKQLPTNILTLDTYTLLTQYFSLPEVPPPTLSVSSQALIKSILLVVGYLFRENKRYLPDYRIALLKTATMARPREVWTNIMLCIVHEFQVLLAVQIVN